MPSTEETQPPDPRLALRAGFVMDMRSRGIGNTRILGAMELVPRAAFVPRELAEFAYADRSLPIACGQSIEKPSAIARLLQALDIEEGRRVLEIGTGSGWTAAILARLGARVVTIERYASLAVAARARLTSLGLDAIAVEHRDGLRPIHDRFEHIVAHGSVVDVPASLVDALLPGGVLILPVGPEARPQELRRIVKTARGVEEASLGPTRVVPLVPGLAQAS